MAQLEQDEKLALAKQAEKAMDKAKNKKAFRAVFTNETFGYKVLGHRVLGRLMVGKTPAEATAGRGKKGD